MLLRLLYWLSLAISLCGPLLQHASADADFESVRTRQMKDRSGKGGDPKQKYFHESVFHPHYDGRFSEKPLNDAKRLTTLVPMIRAYLKTMADIGAETWLMHGTLMGWWWNRKILPWDSDSDVQMTLETLDYVAQYYNMSVFHFKTPDRAEGHSYMLEINPDYATEGPFDKLNTIEARWIDMDSGLFIDITSIRIDEEERAKGHMEALKCKDKHRYNATDLFPLRDSVFEGVPVKIPNQYAWLLEEEYSKASLTRTTFAGHKFNSTTMVWEPIPYPLQRRPRKGLVARPRGQGS